MGIALATFERLFTRMRRAVTRATFAAPRASVMQRPAPVRTAVRPSSVVARQPAVMRRRPVPPLRVVRVVDPAQAPAAAGRMVISGRLADVCAELDRLAAREAAAF